MRINLKQHNFITRFFNNVKYHNNAPIVLVAELNALFLWKNIAQNLNVSYSTGTADYALEHFPSKSWGYFIINPENISCYRQIQCYKFEDCTTAANNKY